ncbi:MAG: DNA mismatch repair ATPase MutS [Saprospiraceae bacterium]|jgi:DNA mismatch repair ATPase MutS
MASIEHVVENYKKRIDQAGADIEIYQGLSHRYSMLRLAVFTLAIPLLYFIIKTNLIVLGLFLIGVISLFVWAVTKQQKYDKLLSEKQALKAINENEIEAIGSHQNLYYDGEEYEISNHHYTGDLDVFGAHSIFGLINRCRTFYGNQILKSEFLEKPLKADLLEKQNAIKELEVETDYRQEIAVKLYSLEGLENFDVAESINRQMEMDLSFGEGRLLNTYRKLLPLIWISIIVLYFINYSIANTLASFLFIGNILLVGNYNKRISEVQGRLSNTSNSLKKYIDVLKSLFDKKWHSSLLKKHAAEFENSASDLPLKSLSDLSNIINQLDYRLNLLVAIVGNGLLLWDLSVIYKLAKWKKSNTGKIEKIFKHIGFMEAMSSLATWAYNHPRYNYAFINDDYMTIEAKELEHPLIPTSQNVENDFKLEKQDKVVIITGSNMSGKSTLLRTIGLNMILGYTGTKVAASSFNIPIVSLVTYMRIKDALEENVSTFKAELNRISMILNVLEEKEDAFILIDEMLRGTNSKDKLNGSIGITKKLLESDAYAMIATHDIKLAEMGNENNHIANYYFDIDYKDGDLVFDYKVKSGICENFNASFLLGQLGIDTEI